MGGLSHAILGMNSWRIDLSWDGSAYCGWQRQPNKNTIQQKVEEALHQIFAGEDIHVLAAGRTDTGVHALQQIASFVAQTHRSEKSVCKGLNALLPEDIVCIHAQKMERGFRARSASKRKLYRYRILMREVHDPLRLRRVWWLRDSFDIKKMRKEAQKFVGTHDFTSFRAARCGAKGSVRTIEACRLFEQNDELIFEVIGKGFLRHQVRIMMGTLVDIGRGTFQERGVEDIIQALDRRKAGMTAPAHGLYLVWTRLDCDEKE